MNAKRLLLICIVAAVLAGCTNTKNQEAVKGGSGSFDYNVINLMDFPYQSFVKNWDNEKNPVLCKIIKTSADFETIFEAAATMDNKKPFTPSEDDFSKYQYVVISKVTIPAVHGFSFKVDSVEYKENHLTVKYTYTKPAEDAGYEVKDGFVLQLSRVPVDSVTVYENTNIVAEIK